MFTLRIIAKKIVRGKTPKLFSTKPLWNHLRRKHPLTIENMDGNTNIEADPPTLNLNPSSPISHSKSHQPTLQSLIKKKEMWSLDDPKAMNITRKICEYFLFLYISNINVKLCLILFLINKRSHYNNKLVL